MNNDRILYLSRRQMDEIGPGLAEIVDLLEAGFCLKGEGKTVMPPKHWLDRSNDRFFSAMSSYIPDIGYGGCKWQSGDPANSHRGLPYIQGVYVLTESSLGIPVAIMDAEWITGRRTAAASALAVKYLAKTDAATLAILGCGLQGRAHLHAIRSVMAKLQMVKAFDIRHEVAEKFAQELGPVVSVAVDVCDSAKAAVEGADVVISGGPITSPPNPLIQAEWLKDGVLGVSIDYDSYWTPGAMHSMDVLTTDDGDQLEHLKEFGFFLGLPRLDFELAGVISGRQPGRTSDKQRILCFNLGIAVEDLVTAVDIYKRAVAQSVGTMLQR